MSMELYVFPASPRAIKVMAVANHLGLDWTMRVLDPRKGEHMSPDYAALNPNCRMPTFKDGDYVLWESNAIMQCLALKKAQSGLLPADEKARLDVTLAVLGSRPLGPRLRRVRLRIYREAPPHRNQRAGHGSAGKGHRGIPPVGEGSRRPPQRAEIRHWRHADAGGFLTSRGHDLCRRGASAGRALWRD
jgi:glutathione S-transferase